MGGGRTEIREGSGVDRRESRKGRTGIFALCRGGGERGRCYVEEGEMRLMVGSSSLEAG
jgi:hypothetical protein